MPRAARFSDTQILDAAAAIIAIGGPGAATIGEIGHRLGAPSGSIYHRFPSRNALLGRLWMQTAASFQDRFVAALQNDDAERAGLEAALSMPRSVRLDPVGARILLLHRRQDFLSDEWSEAMRGEAERLGGQVADALASIAKRLFGRASADDRRAVAFALLDAPMAAVRRHVMTSEPPPPAVDDLLRSTYDAVIGPRLEKRRGVLP
jgi:AcrR family transcriptional regulator